MNPTRLLLSKDGMLRTRQRLLIIAGSILSLYGFVTLGYELWRTFTGIAHEFRWKDIGIAVVLLLSGLIIIQTLNVFKVLEIAYEAYMHSRMVGGRRWSDPPPETAPPALPEDKWPKPDPKWRRRRDD